MKHCAMLFAASMFVLGAAEPMPGFRALVFSKTLMYRHVSITNGIAAIEKLGTENNFSVDVTEDSSAFTPRNLARYKAVVFLNTSGDVLNDAQQDAFKSYVERGGGFVGIHAAVSGKVATESALASMVNPRSCKLASAINDRANFRCSIISSSQLKQMSSRS